MSPTTHIVLFKYSPTIPWPILESHFTSFLALQKTCLNAHGKPYMLSLRMGKNTSWEPFGKGMTHAFFLEFASREDRDYYLLEDPVHHAFSKDVAEKGLVVDSCVVDLEDGVLFSSGSSSEKEEKGKMYPGHCHCGEVGFEVSFEGIEPQHILCHCRTCQLLGGGPYSLNQIVSADKISITRGNFQVYRYTGDSGKEVRCYYCARCTSHVYHVQDAMPGKAIVRTGLLDCSAKMGVGGEIFKEGALGWVGDLKSALPT
jgi:hypothetical protein